MSASVLVRVALRVRLPFPNKFLPPACILPKQDQPGSASSACMPPVLPVSPALSLPSCPALIMHVFEGSAWARILGVPLSDLRLLCGSIDGWGRESRNVHPKSKRENVKTWRMDAHRLAGISCDPRWQSGPGRSYAY